MQERFQRYVREQHLFPPGSTVLLAVSGGRDSVCMAHLVHRVGLPFAVAHCNFHLRPADCDRDQDFVRRMAADFGVPFHTVDFDTRAYAAANGMSIEEAARHLRYRYFARLCREHGYAAVATAHHRDDSIETFFLNLFRGSGLSGLHGILPRTVSTEWADGAGEPPLVVVRPMLGFSRAEIDACVDAWGLDYVEDCTNSELDARRNRIRLQLMPLLRELYGSIDTTMESNMAHLRDAGLLLDAYVGSLRASLVQPVASRVPSAVLRLQAVPLESLRRSLEPYRPQPSVQCTLLFELLRPYGFNAAQAAEMLGAIDTPHTGSRWSSPSHTAVLDRDRLLLAPVADPVPPSIDCRSAVAVDRDAPGIGTTRIYVDASLLGDDYSLRPWRPADRICPFGMQGRQRLVSDMLKDMKLSVIEKEHVYVLCAADGRIVWIVGLRADHRFRVTPATGRICALTVQG